MDPLTVAALGAVGYWVFHALSDDADEPTQNEPLQLPTPHSQKYTGIYTTVSPTQTVQYHPSRHKFASAESCFRNEYVSYSRLRSYSACPQRFKLAYVDGRSGKYSYPRTGPGKGFHQFCERTLKTAIGKPIPSCRTVGTHTDFPEDRKKYDAIRRHLDRKSIIVAVEHELRFRFMDLDYFGIVDLILEDSDGVTHLVDYKTGQNPRPHLEQLELYCLPVLLASHAAKVRCSFVLVDKDERITWDVTAKNRVPLFNNISRMVDHILNDRVFIPNVNSRCKDCGFADICEYYKAGIERAGKPSWPRLTSAKRGARKRQREARGLPTRSIGHRSMSTRSLFAVIGRQAYVCAETGETIPQGDEHYARKNGLRLSKRGFTIRYPGQPFPTQTKAEKYSRHG